MTELPALEEIEDAEVPLTDGAAAGMVTLVEGVTFCICGRSGDIHGAQQGLFFRDTRFISRFELIVDGQHVEPLATYRPWPYAGTFIARRPPRSANVDSTLLVIRRRYVGNGMREDVTIRNLGRETAGVLLNLEVDSDFAGLFEVKEGTVRVRESIQREVRGNALWLGFRRGGETRAVVVTADPPGTALFGTTASATTGSIGWQLVVHPHQETTVNIQVTVEVDGVEVPPRYRLGEPVEASQPATKLAAWRSVTPSVQTPDERLATLLKKSAEDLGVLRIFDPDHPDRAIVAAGAPWFMAIFGRDSLITSWMVLPLDPSLALGTLQTLAELQGKKVDPLSEEEPGRILHEVRSAMDVDLALGGSNIYYGSVDATPLFVMLLGELRRWGLARQDVDALLPYADRALEWITTYGDKDGDGFVEYQRATDRGLVNQGWKDSADSITFASGIPARPPIALAEVQGYVYAAYLARSHFARELGQRDVAEHWAAKAMELKRRFNEEFWISDRGYYAIALDADKKPVDALASNMGHCLWTGIIDEEKAPSVAAHLLGPDMFTGFGVRTLASSMAAYNPMSYHNGSVWPHDNAIVAAGLMRYGFVAEAQRIALGLIDASAAFGGRLPELFCGFDRSEFAVPIPYPASCSPQAWAAAAPFYLLRTLLRFDPWVPFGQVWCAPAVPSRMVPLRVERLHVAGSTVSVDVTADGATVTGLPDGVELIVQARPPLTASSVPPLDGGA
ncbi:MAG: amylo-alpha-1,6-glucosidase [Acidothermus cellulolyticus]|nr:amylo-alpha-1,6-glucosidase [Acidothermus cellulolyticus]